MASQQGAEGEPTSSLQGYSDLVGLGHTPQRLAQLEPEIRALLSELSKLWEIDLGDVGLAVKFRLDDDAADG